MDILTLGAAEVGSLIGFMVENGAWAITAIAMLALVKVYRDKLNEQKEMGELLENRHNEFVTLLTESTKLQATLAELLANIRSVIEKCEKGDKDA